MHLIAYGIVVYNYGSHNPESINVPADENIWYTKCYLRMRIYGSHGGAYGWKYPKLMKVSTDDDIQKFGSAYGWKYPKLMKVSTDDHIQKSGGAYEWQYNGYLYASLNRAALHDITMIK